MLTALEVENFKGIGRPVRVELRPITLLFGPNSAGKSTILQAIHYAHEILSRRNFDPGETHHGGDVVDLGGFKNFVHGRKLERAVRLSFELDLSDCDLPELPLPALRQAPKGKKREIEEPSESIEFFNEGLSSELDSGWVEFSLQWSAVRESPILRTYEVGLNGEWVARIEASDDGAQVELLPNLPHPLFEYDGRRGTEQQDLFDTAELRWHEGPGGEREYWQDHRLPVGGLSRSSLPRWGELLEVDYEESDDSYAYPFREFRYRVSTLLVGLGQLLRDELARLRYIGPMRDVLPRTYSAPRQSVRDRWASGLAAWDLLLERRGDFVAQVSEWLSRKDKLDAGYGLELKSYFELPKDSPLWLAFKTNTYLDFADDFAAEFEALDSRDELRLVDAASDVPRALHPSDVGVGISQVIPVVVAAVDPDRPPLTAIEQPELHIHPKVQVGLGDLFASQIGDGRRCFLIETHSEHIMLRLLRRIEETDSGELPTGAPELRPEQVSVVFVEQVDGEVRTTRLRIDETGEFIDRWPQGFFEERAGELI